MTMQSTMFVEANVMNISATSWKHAYVILTPLNLSFI